ncbi:MAG: 4Fe-4S dicluster domain-containing protein [Clostridiales bacterium]|nr:4Fe-4S dicluster domain-containing protein [Clostridiales bacterium]
MIRKIININKEKCNGCGLCVTACHEGAIELVEGKATLSNEHYCDGLGDCLPACPTGAITFEEREAPAYDEQAVLKAKALKLASTTNSDDNNSNSYSNAQSQLNQWPCQIKLLPVNAPCFENANLLIAADCTAYAYASFHLDFMKERVTLVGCPKLDGVDYSQKLTEIFTQNNIKSIHLVIMSVGCCGGLEIAVKKALLNSGKNIPLKTTVITTQGKILKEF